MSAKVVLANTRRAAGLQTLLSLFSGRLRPIVLLERIARWCAATTAVQVGLRQGGTSVSILRALSCYLFLSRNTQIWILCDALAHITGIPSFRYKNVLLLCLASSEIMTNWICNRHLLLPGYRKFLDWCGMLPDAELSKMRNAVVERQDVQSIVMPKGVMLWTLQHLATRTVPFYTLLKGAQALVTRQMFDVRGVVTSSAFLTAYCGVSSVAGHTVPFLRLAMALPGVAIVLEPSRTVRAAIRHYCLIMALYCRLKDLDVPALGIILVGSLKLPAYAMLNSL